MLSSSLYKGIIIEIVVKDPCNFLTFAIYYKKHPRLQNNNISK